MISQEARCGMKGCDMMSKAEMLHELYEICKDINIYEVGNLITRAEDEEEKGFIRTMTDYILQQEQKKVVAEKRF